MNAVLVKESYIAPFTDQQLQSTKIPKSIVNILASTKLFMLKENSQSQTCCPNV